MYNVYGFMRMVIMKPVELGQPRAGTRVARPYSHPFGNTFDMLTGIYIPQVAVVKSTLYITVGVRTSGARVRKRSACALLFA